MGSGDGQKEFGLLGRHPFVCAALRTVKFEELARVRLVMEEGRRSLAARRFFGSLSSHMATRQWADLVSMKMG